MFSLKKILILFPLSVLPFANLLYPFGFSEDSYSHILIWPWMVIALVYLLKISKIPSAKTYYLLLLFLFLSIIIGSLKILTDEISFSNYMAGAIMGFAKILFLFLYFILIHKESSVQLDQHIRSYVPIFLVSMFAMLLMYIPFENVPRLFFYNDEVRGFRFAGLHYELVNAAFSYIIVFLLLTAREKSIYFIVLFLVFCPILLVVTKSNMAPFFIVATFIGIFFISIPKKIRKPLVLLQFICILFILIFSRDVLFLVDYMSFWFHGGATAGTALYIRAYPVLLAADYIKSQFFSIPFGLFNAQYAPVLNTPNYYGGFGLSKIITDMLWLSIPFLIILIGACIKFYNKLDKSNRMDRTYSTIFTVCIYYIIFQAGFFNITIWAFMLLILKRKEII